MQALIRVNATMVNKKTATPHIAVLGDGAWGTAVATLLAHQGFTVRLWCHTQEVADSIATTGYNHQFLPGVKLSHAIVPVRDIAQAVCGAEWVFEAVPVAFLRGVLEQVRHCFTQEQTWVVLSKGIEHTTLLFPSDIIDDVFGYSTKKVIFSGPSFAHDLSRQQITAVSLASVDVALAQALQHILANHYFRPYVCDDPVGAQVGGALKNVIALAVGLLDGAGYTDNAKAFLLTRGLQEMVHLTTALGGKASTLYGLSGVGDLVLTAMSIQSRNFVVGQRLGKGESLSSIMSSMGGKVPEGSNTVQSVKQLQQKLGISLAICSGVYDVIFKEKALQDMLEALMTFPLESEQIQ